MTENSEIYFDHNENRIAIITSSERLSYANLVQITHDIRKILIGGGLRPGQYISLLGSNNIDNIILLFAIWQVGMVAVPISTRWPDQLIQKMLKKINSSVLVNLSERKVDFADSAITVIQGKDLVRNSRMSKNEITDIKIHFELEREATILFTSGTTNSPKAVLHTFKNHYYSALGSAMNIPFGGGDCWLLSLPLFHIGGMAILFRALLGGGTVAAFLPDQSLEETIRNLNITHISLVATQLQSLLENSRNIRFLKKLRVILLGGGPIAPRLIEKALDEKLPVFSSFGSTEMSSQITTTSNNDTLPQLLTAGRVLPYRELVIAEDSEIWVRGKTLFKGYLNENEIDTARDENGWFHTGDLGQLDQSGYLTITGRKDNMFISGGENIQPEEIEKAILQSPLISNAMVVPIDHPKYGKRPVAFVKMQARKMKNTMVSDNKTKELTEHLGKLLPKYKIPDYFFIWPEGDDAMKFSRTTFQELAKNYISRKLGH